MICEQENSEIHFLVIQLEEKYILDYKLCVAQNCNILYFKILHSSLSHYNETILTLEELRESTFFIRIYTGTSLYSLL